MLQSSSLLTCPCVLKLCRLLSPVQKMAAILAAASHDVDHPGVNHAFLVATENPLVSLYTVCIKRILLLFQIYSWFRVVITAWTEKVMSTV